MNTMKEKRESREQDREGKRVMTGKNRGQEEAVRGSEGLRAEKREVVRGVIRVQGNEISICWRKKRKEEINMEKEKNR